MVLLLRVLLQRQRYLSLETRPLCAAKVEKLTQDYHLNLRVEDGFILVKIVTHTMVEQFFLDQLWQGR